MNVPSFKETLESCGLAELRAVGLNILQVNMGKVCNQSCKHCNVDAGPDRTESMIRETADSVLAAVRKFHIPNVDLTGGAPELNRVLSARLHDSI